MIPKDYTIVLATPADAAAITDITHRAFALYAQETPGAHVSALDETADDVVRDITQNRVFAAKNADGRLLGAVRYCALSDELAYLYRFGVDPDINNTGIGSDLIGTVIDECTARGFKAIALHTNAKYFKLARYYYGKQFYVHSTANDRGYIRALFVRDLTDAPCDISPALQR